jgi:hypothetical protein
LIQEIYKSSAQLLSTLLSPLRAAASAVSCLKTSEIEQGALSIYDFTVSLRIYGQYIPENSSSLNICKLFTRDLNAFLLQSPYPNISLESYLILPVEHYVEYQVIFEKLLYLFQRIVVSSQAADSASAGGAAGRSQKTEELIAKAQRLILEISDSIDEKLQEEREKQVLLAVQSQCSYSPPPFLFSSLTSACSYQ